MEKRRGRMSENSVSGRTKEGSKNIYYIYMRAALELHTVIAIL